MKVNVGELAQIGLRDLGEDGRRKAWGWIDSLKRWDTDPFVSDLILPPGEAEPVSSRADCPPLLPGAPHAAQPPQVAQSRRARNSSFRGPRKLGEAS